MLTTVLDLLGVACLAAAGWFVFAEPGALVVVGSAALLASRKASA